MNVEDWLEDRLDIISRAGAEVRIRNCLFCGRARSMKINTERRKFICFHGDCQASGGLVRLVQAVESCTLDEAIRITTNMLRGVTKARPLVEVRDLWEDLQRDEPAAEVTDDGLDLKIPLPPEFVPCWDGKKWRTPKYLTERRVRRDAIERWGIGFCPHGTYGGRVVVPVRCAGMSSFVARDTVKGDRFRPKYLAPLDAGGHMLFGFDEVKPGQVIAVEGVFDAIRLWTYGFQAVAYFGDHLTPSQIELLERIRPLDLLLMPDGDDPKAQAKAVHAARSIETRFRSVQLALLAGGDPDDVGRAEVVRAVREASSVADHDAAAIRLRAVRRSPLDL